MTPTNKPTEPATPKTDPPHTKTTNANQAGHWNLGGDRPVARMGFGAMRLPARDFGGPAGDPVQGVAVLRRAVELGVNHIDTAAFYFHEDVSANALIRTALHPYPEDLVIATKVGPGRAPDGAWLDPANPDELRAAVHRNLRELGRDHLDLVYLRFLPSDGAPGDRFAALAELREQGLIRHLGVSNASVEQLAQAQQIAPVVAVQNRYGVGSRTDSAVVEACAEQGIAFVPFFSIVGLGEPEAVRVKAIAERYGATVPQIKLAWTLALSPTTLAIPGTSSVSHLEENVAAGALRLSADDVAELDGLGGR